MRKNSIHLMACITIIGCLLVLSKKEAFAQKETYNVAIFLYQGAELLDFSGPGEVFGASRGFKVYTVSADGKPILSQRFMTIQPEYSLDNVPPTDILIFPGGNSTPSSKDPKVLEWIKTSAEAGSMVLSVCTGAEILAQTGLLENLNVTTYHGFIPGLQQMLPNSKVLRDTRYVDNGNIMTTAGVSAGIDGALHLLARIKGLDVARATATYMEYDKWKPEEGQIDYQNPYIKELLTAYIQPEKNIAIAIKDNKGRAPYEGEFKNAAFSLMEKGNKEQAARVLEQGRKVYPNSGSISNELAKLYRQMGKPAPMDAAALVTLIRSGSTDKALAAIEKDRKSFPGWDMINENDINREGYHLMMMEDMKTAIKVFDLNTKLFPESANTFDSLGEAYLRAGDKKAAITNYKKSLAMDPENTNAKKVLEEIGKE